MIQPTLTGNDVAVYYLHSTFRCDTCNTIEKMTKDLLERNYTAELQTGRIVWSEVDFQEDLALAEKFEVAASCVVVAKLKDGNISSYSRLDEVWTLMEDPQAFDSYIKSAIEIALNSGDK